MRILTGVPCFKLCHNYVLSSEHKIDKSTSPPNLNICFQDEKLIVQKVLGAQRKDIRVIHSIYDAISAHLIGFRTYKHFK